MTIGNLPLQISPCRFPSYAYLPILHETMTCTMIHSEHPIVMVCFGQQSTRRVGSLYDRSSWSEETVLARFVPAFDRHPWNREHRHQSPSFHRSNCVPLSTVSNDEKLFELISKQNRKRKHTKPPWIHHLSKSDPPSIHLDTMALRESNTEKGMRI